MTIIEYRTYNDITVKFENNYIIDSAYKEFKSGNISNPYDTTIYNIGYIGEGVYKTSTIQYIFWKNMLKRCYDENYIKKYSTYEKCEVCEEWHCLQVFAKWFDENYYECNDGYKMDLDKDILCKGNKIYSPKNCVFVPHRINTLFTKRQNYRGDYPIGVEKIGSKFRARCTTLDINNKRSNIHLGMFNTPEDAFYEGYKPFKESYIKEVANDYKDIIPIKLYNSMMNYEVEITD